MKRKPDVTLRAVVAKVEAIDFTGIERDYGTPRNDLNDLCNLSTDGLEDCTKVRSREVLP